MIFCKKFFKLAAVSVLAVSAVSCAKKDNFLAKNGATFYVDSVAGSFTADGAKNDLTNRKFVNLTACIKDNALTAAVMNLKFKISAGDIITTKTTDERGCLVWQELWSFEPSQDERQIPVVRTITAVEGHSGAEVVQLAYNPWDNDKLIFLKREAARNPESVNTAYAAGGMFTRLDVATNQTYTSNIDIRMAVLSANLQKCYITNINLQFLKRDFDQYRVSPALGLSIAHRYRLKFNAAVLRKTLNLGTVSLPITSGNFKFYFVLLREGYDPRIVPQSQMMKYVVSANEFNSAAEVGRFISDTTLKFSNVAALASRMTSILTMESAEFAESSFEGALTPIAGAGSQSVDVIPSQISAKSIYQQYSAAQSQLVQKSGMQLFAENSGYSGMDASPLVINVPAGRMGQVTKVNYDVGNYFNKKRAGQTISAEETKYLGTALCFKYFNGSLDLKNPVNAAAYEKCYRNPDKMFTTTTREFVDSLNSTTPRKVGIPQVENLRISTGMEFVEAKNTSKGKKDTRSYAMVTEGSAGIGGSLPIPFLKISGSVGAKFSTGREWYNTVDVTSTSSSSTKASANREILVNSESFRFAVDVNTRSCLLVAPTQELENALVSVEHPAGKFLCTADVQRQNREEVYYFLNETSGLATSPLSDNMSAEDNPWRMFIRGNQTYNMFAQLFAQKGLKLTLQKFAEDDILGQFNDFYVTQEYPGMLSAF